METDNILDKSYLEKLFKLKDIQPKKIIVNFGYNKIFVNESIEFVFDTILKTYKKTSLGIGRDFNQYNVFELPETYEQFVLEKLSIKGTIFLKIEDLNNTVSKTDLKQQCKEYQASKYKLKQITDSIIELPIKTETELMTEILTIQKQLLKYKLQLEFTLKLVI